MGILNNWENYLDEKERVLLQVVESPLYEGDFEGSSKDFYERLYSNPMYPQLERRLIEDIERVESEKIKFFRELEDFYQREFLSKSDKEGTLE